MKNKLPRLAPLLLILAAIALIATRDRDDPTAPSASTNDQPAARPEALSVSNGGLASPQPTQPPQPTAKPETPTPGNQLITQAATRLERRASIASRVYYQVFLGGESLHGYGNYWQQGSGDDLRVRLEIPIAGQDASLLQVSDSRFLWLERRLPTGRIVTRVDLRQLRADPSLSPDNLDGPEPGSATWSSTGANLIAHTGGLSSLLASLDESFDFMTPQALRFRIDKDTDAPKSARIPYYAVVGHWRPEKLAALLSKGGADFSPSDAHSEDAEATGNESNATSDQTPAFHSPLSTLPTRLPQEVLILVGQADLFPYRIEYRRLETAPNGPPIPYQLSANPMVVLEFIDVVFDTPIATGQFDYTPGDAEWTDQTATILHRLRQQTQFANRAANPRK